MIFCRNRGFFNGLLGVRSGATSVKRSWLGSALILPLVAFSPLFITYDGRQANFLFAFFLGGLLFQLRDRFTYRYSILTSLSLLLVLIYGNPDFEFVLMLWLVLIVFVIGTIQTNAFKWIEKCDLSYGLYLYAFPLGQASVATFKIVDPLFLTIVTIVMGGVIASASWIFVERPCLLKKETVADLLVNAQVFSHFKNHQLTGGGPR